MDLLALTKTAIQAARNAGSIIQQHLEKEVEVEKKETGASLAAQVVTKVDRACEAAILGELKSSCEKWGIASLSEETEDDGSRFEKDYFWCIDPLDGTLPFIEGRPGFSVSIALLAKDGTPRIGVVFDPGTDTLYHAIQGQGAFRNAVRWKASCSNQHLTYVTDRKLKDTPRSAEIEALLQAKAEELGLEEVREISGAGSVLNAIRVLEQGPACMLKFPKPEKGGGSIWDFAATACIFQELGLRASNFFGSALDLNRKDNPFMNHEGVFYANW